LDIISSCIIFGNRYQEEVGNEAHGVCNGGKGEREEGRGTKQF